MAVLNVAWGSLRIYQYLKFKGTVFWATYMAYSILCILRVLHFFSKQYTPPSYIQVVEIRFLNIFLDYKFICDSIYVINQNVILLLFPLFRNTPLEYIIVFIRMVSVKYHFKGIRGRWRTLYENLISKTLSDRKVRNRYKQRLSSVRLSGYCCYRWRGLLAEQTFWLASSSLHHFWPTMGK